MRSRAQVRVNSEKMKEMHTHPKLLSLIALLRMYIVLSRGLLKETNRNIFIEALRAYLNEVETA